MTARQDHPELARWADFTMRNVLGRQLQSLFDENDRLRAALTKLTVHHECDDCWYSCPLAADPCCNEDELGCTCHAKIARAALGMSLADFEGPIENEGPR